MFTVTKEFSFEAAHSLPHLPEGHKCRNLHGHSYKVVVHVASGSLDSRGFVVDYADITDAVAPIIAELDHKNINEFIEPSTAEHLAKWLYGRIRRTGLNCCAIEVRETEKTNVIYC